MTRYDVEEVIDLVLVENGDLCRARLALDRMKRLFPIVHRALLPGGLGESKLECLCRVHGAVLNEHGPVLVLVQLVSLAVQTEKGKTGWTVEDSVAVGQRTNRGIGNAEK